MDQIHLLSILRACENLEYLNLETNTSSIKNLSPQDLHYNLKSLSLATDKLTADQLVYFVRYLPNLSKLKLITVDGTLESIIATLDPKQIRDIALYFKKLEYLQIKELTGPTYHNNTGNGRTVDQRQKFWGFIHYLCGKGSECSLVAELVQVSEETGGANIKKVRQTFSIDRKLLWNRWYMPSTWIDHIYFFKFDSISINVNRTTFNDSTNNNLIPLYIYDCLIYPVLKLLNNQVHKQKPTFLDITCGPQKVCISHRNLSMHGLLKELTLHDALLSSLGKLYPSLNYLDLTDCKLQAPYSNIYHLNLSEFDDIHQLTFDLDVMFKGEKICPLYIQLINSEDAVDYYNCEFNKQRTLYNRKTEGELTIPKSHVLLKIRHRKIRILIFKMGGEIVSVELV
jgi:hypothetical protein